MLLLIVLSAGCVTDMTVKFYVDDRVYYQTSVDGTNPINLPPNPTKDGYYFAGWYFDKGVWEKPLTVTSLLEMPIAGEIAVYAYFTGEGAVSYKVTLDSNGGSFVEPVSVLKNGKIPVPNSPERPHHTFVGWYTTPDYKSGKMWDFQTDVVTSDITLYAGWKPENEAAYYLDGFKQTSLNGVESLFIDDGKVYITYYLAKVDGTVLSVLTDPIYNTGGQSLSVYSSTEITDSTTESLEQSISEATGSSTSKTTSKESSYSKSYSTSVESSFSAGFPGLQAGVKIGGESSSSSGTTTGTSSAVATTWDTAKSISESESKTVSRATSSARELHVSLDGYAPNYQYRYVIQGDCVITKTYVYDRDTQTILAEYYDSKVIDGSLKTVIEYCNEDEDFTIPKNMLINAQLKESVNTIMTSLRESNF